MRRLRFSFSVLCLEPRDGDRERSEEDDEEDDEMVEIA